MTDLRALAEAAPRHKVHVYIEPGEGAEPEKQRRFGADWRTSALTQVRFGIAYANARYGSPCAAEAHRQRNGWW